MLKTLYLLAITANSPMNQTNGDENKKNMIGYLNILINIFIGIFI
jgi:hypothetical protein